MPHRLPIAAVAATLLVLPASASAQSLPTAPIEGFAVSQTSQDRLRLDIGPAANRTFRPLAGRRAQITCQVETPSTGPYLAGLAQNFRVQSIRFTLPERRRGVTLRPRLRADYDSCALDVAPRGNRAAFSVLLPLTDTGAAALAERVLVTRMVFAAGVVGELTDNPQQAYPATAVVVEALGSPAAVRRTVGAVEPLTDRFASPTAPGAIGVWTDGGKQASFVGFNFAGRRISLDVTGDALTINSQYLLR